MRRCVPVASLASFWYCASCSFVAFSSDAIRARCDAIQAPFALVVARAFAAVAAAAFMSIAVATAPVATTATDAVYQRRPLDRLEFFFLGT